MNLQTLYDRCHFLDSYLGGLVGIKSHTCYAVLNEHYSDEATQVVIQVRASEEWRSESDGGYWSRSASFSAPVTDVARILDEASQWVFNIPEAEERAADQAIKVLTKMAGRLPKDAANAAAQAIFDAARKTLLAEAERLAANCLPRATD